MNSAGKAEISDNSIGPSVRKKPADLRMTIGIGGRVAPPPPSRPGEFRPEPLTEPDVNLSIHPARATPERLPPCGKTMSSSGFPLTQSHRG
jgi:hypothetical protein